MIVTGKYNPQSPDAPKAAAYLSDSWEKLRIMRNMAIIPKSFEIKKDKGLFVYDVEVTALNPGWLALLVAAPNAYFQGPAWVYAISLVLVLLGLFWSRYYLWLKIRGGLRKSGYKDSLKMISYKDFISEYIRDY